MQNWMTGVLIAACLIYGFLLFPKTEPQTADANPVALADNRSLPHEEPAPPPAAPAASLTFGGYPCNSDCSIQQAGYRWAQQNSVTDEDACTGESAEFIEGCRVYARQRSGNS